MKIESEGNDKYSPIRLALLTAASLLVFLLIEALKPCVLNYKQISKTNHIVSHLEEVSKDTL